MVEVVTLDADDSPEENVPEVEKLQCGLLLRERWLKASSFTGEDAILERLLDADLRAASSGSTLPADMVGLHNVTLSGNVLLQVVSASDVAASKRSLEKSRIALEEEEDGENGDGNPGQQKKNGQPAMPTPKRLLKIDFTDGKNRFIGIEHRRIEALQGYPGEKVLLKEIPIRRGIMLLSPDNLVVLGGKDFRERKASSSSSLAAAMQPQQKINPQIQPASKHPQQQGNNTIGCVQSGNQAMHSSTLKSRTPSPVPPATRTPSPLPPKPAETKPAPNASLARSSSSQSQSSTSTNSTQGNRPSPAQHAPRFVARPIQSAPATKMFAYLEDISIGDSAVVKGFVSGISKFTISTDECSLLLEIGDGKSVREVSVSHTPLEHLLQLPIAEIQVMKRTQRQSYKAHMAKASERIRAFEGLFRIECNSSGDGGSRYALLGVENERASEYTQYLLSSMQQKYGTRST